VTAPPLILVRVTVKLQGIGVGDVVWVNPDDPYIRELLIGGDAGPYLVPADEGLTANP
jgi:hypothetical protein